MEWISDNDLPRLHGPRNLVLTQYYRPPFPLPQYWRDDLARMADAGLDGIVAWAPWAWVEATPGAFVFDDLDELFDETERAGLGVVMSAGAEFSPHWIHREIPDSHMVDHTGRRVYSSTPPSLNQGLSPGACTDNPEVRERAGRYLEELGRHFGGRPNLLHWDCWCELNWTWEADGHHLCFCRHTVDAFRRWLGERHGGLDGLAKAWNRRYSSWEDVLPGVRAGRNWTETVAFQEFLAWRNAENVSFRVGQLRAGDPGHSVIAHSHLLSTIIPQESWEQPLSRGNDWEVATRLDGFGASHFPLWFQTENAEYGVRLESARGAARGKPYWVSELQGGSARHGLGVMPSVSAARQQRWIWTGYSRGAEGVSFWCWRDDVMGREAGGFGVVNDDGHAEERVGALKRLTRVLRDNSELLGHYVPDPARTAVIFDGVNHQLDWADSGLKSSQSKGSVRGYLLCLERLQVPFDVLEASHLTSLDPYSVIFLPWPMVVRPELAAALESWVAGGGTLVVESELDAYDENCFYRYPQDRPFPRALGIRSLGRRRIEDGSSIPFTLEGVSGELRPTGWLDPITGDGEAIGSTDAGTVILRRAHKSGTVFAVGTHAALGYSRERYPDFERLIDAILELGGGLPDLRCSIRDGELVQWRTGRSGDRRLVFVTNGGPAVSAEFTAPAALLGGREGARDIVCDRQVDVASSGDAATFRLSLSEDDAWVLVF